MRHFTTIVWVCLAAALSLRSAGAQECDGSFDSTFELIQAAIFDRTGCNSVTCHTSEDVAGGLDLTAGAAYANLVDAAVQSVAVGPTMRRVVPAKKENSLLWLNVAAAALPDDWQAPLRPMPQGGLAPLTLAELEVIRLWIEGGAPERGVVAGTADLLNACLPPPLPLETKPLDPPPAGTGLQFKAPMQMLPPLTEREVCFVSYYDVTDQVPELYRGPGGDTFRFRRIDARQDPLSHHAVVVNYGGVAPLESPVWGAFTCGGGDRHGEPCNPRQLDACGTGVCGSTPQESVGCFGFGPGDAGIGVGNDSLFNTMAAGLGSVEGIYAEAPLKGILVWNSHSFNVTNQPGKLDIWVNLDFAPPDEQIHQLKRFTVIDEMFRLNVPPFAAQQLCGHYVVPVRERIIELSSHNHKRGVRFQTFEGAFRCQGGNHDGDACSPLDDDRLGAPDICAGAPCIAHVPPAAGDCNGDLVVRVDELVTAVGIALGAPRSRCPRADANGDGLVSISEIITGVLALLDPKLRDAEASRLYTSLFYADPAVVKFDPPKRLAGPRSVDDERTLTYCGLFENGVLNFDTIKRRSLSPGSIGGFPGGACAAPVACVEGQIGAACATDANCDSAPGEGDGFCDACPVQFGTTTDDEMFILLGAAYEE